MFKSPHWASLIDVKIADGLVAAVSSTGIPSLVMPFAAGQFFWARRLQALGVAPAPLSRKRLDAATLATAIAFAEAPETRARAAALGAAMANEDGLATGVAMIETRSKIAL